jgi:hypothetical protein
MEAKIKPEWGPMVPGTSRGNPVEKEKVPKRARK